MIIKTAIIVKIFEFAVNKSIVNIKIENKLSTYFCTLWIPSSGKSLFSSDYPLFEKMQSTPFWTSG